MSASFTFRRALQSTGRSLAATTRSHHLAPAIATTSFTMTASTRSFATGTRGSRGHGWYTNYRAGKGGRHLQGQYHDRDLDECAKWNESIFELGHTKVYLDLVVEPRSSSSSSPPPTAEGAPPLDSLTGEKQRLVMDIATTVMPETTQNFLDLCRADTEGYTGSILYRFEKGVGLCGGDVLTNTGKSGKAANGDPLAMDISTDPLALWHLEGTVTMLVAKVGQVDSRFVLCTDTAPHLDGINRAFGRLTKESIEVLKTWQATLLTKNGAPTSVDLVVVEAGVLGENASSEQAA